MDKKYFVEIISIETDAVEKTLGPYASRHLADKAENGVMRNLNFDDFYTQIVESA